MSGLRCGQQMNISDIHLHIRRGKPAIPNFQLSTCNLLLAGTVCADELFGQVGDVYFVSGVAHTVGVSDFDIKPSIRHFSGGHCECFDRLTPCARIPFAKVLAVDGDVHILATSVVIALGYNRHCYIARYRFFQSCKGCSCGRVISACAVLGHTDRCRLNTFAAQRARGTA